MYNEHFGLQQAPFRITPDTRLFYEGGGRGRILDALVYAIVSGEGIVKVVGEVGTGKTMLCRMLEERLPKNVEIVYLANPSLKPDDILQAIAMEMKLDIAPGSNRLKVMHAMQHHLLKKHASNRQVVVFVEEAQSMPIETLEEIRLLSNLETQREKLLQIVLFGQPELDENLDQANIRQLKERITHCFYLEPLDRDELRDYVNFRMRAVGYRGPDVFRSNAYVSMARASEGLTRRINILADKALLAAFAEDRHEVKREDVRKAINDSQFEVRRRRRAPWLAVGAGILLLAGLAGFSALGSVERLGFAPSAVESDSAPSSAGSVPGEDEAPPAAAAERLEAPSGADSAQQVARAESAPAAEAMVSAPPVPAIIAPTTTGPGSMAATVTTPPERENVLAPDTAFERHPEALPQEKVAVVRSAAPVDQRPIPEQRGTYAETPGMVLIAAAARAAMLPPDADTDTATREPGSAGYGAGAAAPESISGSAADTRADTRLVSQTMRSKPAGLIAARIAATRQWLAHANEDHYSIQLLLTARSQQQHVEEFLEQRNREGKIGDVYVYETVIDDRPYFGVLYREFSGYSAAKRALDDLPTELKRLGPFIRNVRDVSSVS